MLISVSAVGITLSAFPSDKKVQFHANTCTPGAESWIQFSSWLVASAVPLVLEWSPWQRYFLLSGAYISALQVFHREVHCSSRILGLPGIWQYFLFDSAVFSNPSYVSKVRVCRFDCLWNMCCNIHAWTKNKAQIADKYIENLTDLTT